MFRCALCGSPVTINYNNTNKYGTRNYYYICTGKIKYGVSYCNNSNKNNHVLYKILLNHLINFKIPTVDKKIIAKPL
ncbi:MULTISPECIES: recombinase zinc beta ribbon domain-containing protein [Clostridium]|uniref:recombinase zinc beta ribbon domain-containing protein n=1 Tax=Clostridium TaxID=1485 RepID=UPI0009EAD0B7